jgi:type I restriction enzyme S subunit
MAKTKKVPELRFKGFKEEWEEKELGNNSEIVSGGTPNTAIAEYWEPKQIPWMSSGEINKKRLYETENKISFNGLNNSSARWIKKNSVLVALAGQGKTRGMVAINCIPLTTNQSIAAIMTNEQLNYEFLYQNLGMRYDELRTVSSGDGTRGGLNKRIICDILISSPALKEQIKIGSLFNNLDALIDLHKRKHDKLLAVKKAMLEKMFPKEGADVPELRFEGFAGKWQSQHINELADRYDNLRIPITAKNRIPGEVPYYGANGIQDFVEGYTHNGEFILVAEDGANDTMNYPVQYVNGKFWANNHTHVLKSKKSIADIRFLKYAISHTNIERFLVGCGRLKLNAEIMMNINIVIPNDIEEQVVIGSYFTSLDSLIALHQKELDKLKNIKKACLEKMLV